MIEIIRDEITGGMTTMHTVMMTMAGATTTVIGGGIGILTVLNVGKNEAV